LKSIRWRLLLCTLLCVGALAAIGLFRMQVDTDIMEYLPHGDPIISDAGYFLKHHPAQNQIIVDVSLGRTDPNALVSCGRFVARRLEQSGLFKQVGMGALKEAFPILLGHVLDSLPVLFTEKQLREEVAPMLAPDLVRERLIQIRKSLLSLESTGQSELISRDPLEMRNLVLKRLSLLAPVKEMVLHDGQILSPDKRHLLLAATPAAAGTDTGVARRLTRLFNTVSRELHERYGTEAKLTPMGAYRAALDNEKIVRQDVQRAILLTMVGIALLLIFAFPRPLIGLFAFVPALAGTATALFVFSLYHHAISIMVLGFGGAVISITVDHGIAYLLFLDRPEHTSGKAASREIRGVGLFATLTTMGAFGALCLSDFPMLNQLGQFTALGIGFSFLFVHAVFPRIFPDMPPGRNRGVVLRRLIDRVFPSGKIGAYGALFFGVFMLFFAWPETDVNLSTMNTVSEETNAAEQLMGRVWGNTIFGKVHFLTHSKSLKGLREKGDRVLDMMTVDMNSGVLSSGFAASMIFPGESQQRENFIAWRDFWTAERRAALKAALQTASTELGFSPGAFTPFYEAIAETVRPAADRPIPESLRSLMGISRGEGPVWYEAASFIPGKAYAPEQIYQRYGALGRLFDPAFFSQKFGALLFSTFMKMLIMIGISVGILLFFFFLDWRLTILSLLPVLFALVSTLGTLNLAGHPLDIPGLMLSIVVLGMGVDYALYITRSYQRYGSDQDPGFGLIRTAVFMASASTMIGFGALCFSAHSLLRSAGFTSLLGIGYSAVGAFIILPPILRAFFQGEGNVRDTSAPLNERVLSRFRKREAYPRLFAWFKMRVDPMFSELPWFLDVPFQVKRILDVGCGYGVPGCWLLERFPSAILYGLDPDGERVRIAARVFGERGRVIQGRAPQVPMVTEPADLALLLDMIHHITDDELRLTLNRLNRCLRQDGRLILRVAIPPQRDPSWPWRLASIGHRLLRISVYYRTVEQLTDRVAVSGFQVRQVMPSGGKGESMWIIADKRSRTGAVDGQDG